MSRAPAPPRRSSSSPDPKLWRSVISGRHVRHQDPIPDGGHTGGERRAEGALAKRLHPFRGPPPRGGPQRPHQCTGGAVMARNIRLFYLFRLLATSYLWIPVLYHFMTERGLGFNEIMTLAAVYSAVVI